MKISKSLSVVPYLFIVFLISVYSLANATELPGPLVSTDWLAKNRDNVSVLEVRKDTKSFTQQTSGGNVYGHIPGSVLVPRPAFSITKKGALHGELPSKESFEQLMQKSGVNQDSLIVVSDRGSNFKEVGFGTRLYWTLKYFGHDNVALLDGGTAKWAAEKRKVAYDASAPNPGNWKAQGERKEILASLQDVEKTVSQKGQIVDGLPEAFYLGLKLKKGVVAKPGHIAGAKSLPVGVLVDGGPKGATFYPAEKLKKVVSALGIDDSKPVTTHCNTGHIASLTWFALSELLGNKKAKLYDGSMEEWSKTKGHPVSTFVME